MDEYYINIGNDFLPINSKLINCFGIFKLCAENSNITIEDFLITINNPYLEKEIVNNPDELYFAFNKIILFLENFYDNDKGFLCKLKEKKEYYLTSIKEKIGPNDKISIPKYFSDVKMPEEMYNWFLINICETMKFEDLSPEKYRKMEYIAAVADKYNCKFFLKLYTYFFCEFVYLIDKNGEEKIKEIFGYECKKSELLNNISYKLESIEIENMISDKILNLARAVPHDSLLSFDAMEDMGEISKSCSIM